MTTHTNPYVAGAPVTDQRMFFGREDVFTWIEQNIGGQFSDNMLVVHGQRRVGKTSVLKQLGNYISDKYIPVFFDFQGRTHTTINKFLYRLAREIVRTLSREYGIEMPRPESEAFEKDAEYFADTFIVQACETLGDKNLLLVFDEFDTLEERTSRDMLGQYLVPYFSRMIHGAQNLNFIFSIGSSGHKLEDMRAEYTDFFRVGLYKRISFLSTENSRRLITEPVQGIMDYKDEAVERVVEITSGHPYFIQLLCHELFAKAQRKDDWHIILDDIEEVMPDVIERGTVNLKFVWDVASSAERYTLAALATIGRASSKEEILDLLRKNKVRISDEEVGQALIELVARDVLSNEYGFRVELLRLWLLENRPLERVIEELAEKHPVAVRHTQIAEEHREEDQIEKALDSYKSALSAAPKYIPAQLGIAKIYQETGRWLEAIETYEKVRKIDPKDERAKSGLCESLIALGDAAQKLENLAEAKERYQEALKINNEHIEACERLAALSLSQVKSLSAQKKWKVAGENLIQAWQYIPESVQTAPGEETFQIKNIDELENAINPLQDALASIRTQLAKDELMKAIELREREQYSAAIAKLERALAYEPSHAEIQKEIQATKNAERAEGGDKIYTKGKRAFNAQRWSEAANILQRYLELDPDDSRRVKKAKAWIEDARLQEDLAERYAAARQAIERGVTRRAISLLQEIKYLEENYRDVDWLLNEARGRWIRDLFSKFAFGAMGTFIIIFLGWFLLRPGGAMQNTAVQIGFYENTPTATATATLPPATSTPTPVLTSTPTPTPTPVPLAWKRLDSTQFLPRDIVRVLVIDPTDADIWYAATNGAGVYKTVNGGVSWLPIQNGLGRTGITNMVIAHDDPMKLYLSTGEGPPYKTINGGLTWENVKNGVNLNNMGPSNGDIAIDPQDSDHLFYLNSSGVYETKDGASSWKKVRFGSEISDCGVPTQIRFSPADPNIVILLTGGPFDTCNSIVRSTDGGKTWATGIEEIGGFWNKLWIEPSQGNYVYVRSSSVNSSYRSEDAGETWGTNSNDCTMMAFIPEDEKIAYCFGWGGWLSRTLDGGQNWQNITQLSMQDGRSLAIVPTDSTKFLAGGDGGVFLSTDSGLSWEERSSGLGATTSTLTVDPVNNSILYLESSADFGGKPWPFYRSTDGGSNWEFVDQIGRNLTVDANEEILYRMWEKDIWGRRPGEPGAVMRSYDHGATWEIGAPMPAEFATVHYLYADPKISGKLFVNGIFSFENGDDNGCIESLDFGDTWQPTDCKFIPDENIEFITYNNDSYYVTDKVVDPNQPNVKYAGTDGGAFISFNSGVSWTPINDGLLDGLVIHSLVVDDMSNVYASTPLGIFRLEQK